MYPPFASESQYVYNSDGDLTNKLTCAKVYSLPSRLNFALAVLLPTLPMTAPIYGFLPPVKSKNFIDDDES